jgi:hypothetical protein
MPQTFVEVYSARDGDTYQIDAEEIKRVATRDLGMVQGPFELNIFTKTILATALQREQIERNEALRKTMESGGDWKAAVQAVTACTELMEKLGVDDAKWDPRQGGAVSGALPKLTKAPEPPVKADVATERLTLELDGQARTEL